METFYPELNTKNIITIFLCFLAMSFGVYNTLSFLNDTEAGNADFTAGIINIETSNSSSTYNMVELPGWDFGAEIGQFINLENLKPGDRGTTNIGIKIETNDSWLCAKYDFSEFNENQILEPEFEDGDTTTTNEIWGGELQTELDTYIFLDENCNGIQDAEERLLFRGKLSDMGLSYGIAIADSNSEVIEANIEYCMVQKWCFGDFDELYGCTFENVGNLSQTDSVLGDLTFSAIQERHNLNFECPVGTIQ